MRVLLAYQPVDGGVGRHVSDLAYGLVERGFDVLLCGPREPMGNRHLPPGVELFPIDLGRSISPVRDLAGVRRAAALLRRADPDLVHAHSSKAGAIMRLARAALPSVPVVYTPHLYAFASVFPHEWERPIYRAFEQVLAPLASRVLCVCEAEARLAAQIGPRSRIRVVRNGVEPFEGDAIESRPAPDDGGPAIAVVSHLSARKGIETLIDAAPLVGARHPTATFTIWGDGPEREQLEARAAGVGAAGLVRFMGATRSPRAAIRGATMLAHPSLAEALPYAILDALAAGIPVVATDVGGVGEAVRSGTTGVLVPAADPVALADAVSELLDAPEMMAAMGRAARALAESEFSLGRMLDGVAEVYSELLAARRQARRPRVRGS